MESDPGAAHVKVRLPVESWVRITVKVQTLFEGLEKAGRVMVALAVNEMRRIFKLVLGIV
jgi:hypothetical protein